MLILHWKKGPPVGQQRWPSQGPWVPRRMVLPACQQGTPVTGKWLELMNSHENINKGTNMYQGVPVLLVLIRWPETSCKFMINAKYSWSNHQQYPISSNLLKIKPFLVSNCLICVSLFYVLPLFGYVSNSWSVRFGDPNPSSLENYCQLQPAGQLRWRVASVTTKENNDLLKFMMAKLKDT